MDVTPYASLSNEELLKVCYSKTDPTDLELELAQRLTFAQDHIEDLENEIDPPVSTVARIAA